MSHLHLPFTTLGDERRFSGRSAPRSDVHRDWPLAEWAETHFGIITHRKLRQLGFSQDDIRGRVQRGSLIPAGAGVFYVGHRSGVAGQREAVAIAAAGPDAVLAGPPAAAWRGMTDAWHGRIHLLVPLSRKADRDGATRSTAVLLPEDRMVWRGLPCVTPERAVMDLPRDRLRQALQWLMREGIALEPIVERMHGRRGAVAFRAEVELLIPQLAHTLSELEARFVRLCERYGMPIPVVNGTLAGGDLLDCTWPGTGLVVELDGRKWHQDRDLEDRARDRRRVLEGRITLRYGWFDVTRNEELVAREVAQVLARESRLAGRSAR